jgi:hypothetical protein
MYPAVLLMYFISAAFILLASPDLIVQVIYIMMFTKDIYIYIYIYIQKIYRYIYTYIHYIYIDVYNIYIYIYLFCKHQWDPKDVRTFF